MYCAETAEEAEEGWTYFYNLMRGAQYHYFEWANPGFKGIRGYEVYAERQAAEVGMASPRRWPYIDLLSPSERPTRS